MKKFFSVPLILILMFLLSCENEQSINWEPRPNPLMTRWSADIDPEMPWPEYPRPQMVRDEWLNLNGLWDYQLVRAGNEPGEYLQKILVPYPVESALSGIADSVGPDDMIMYRRFFEVPDKWNKQKTLLHFEAVDWETKVILNGEEVGAHKGGYDPFTFDITKYLLEDDNELIVRVKDPTSEGYQPRGKQVLSPGGIWYTPTSGIWQTVWLESVPETHISEVLIKPSPSEGKVSFEFICNNLQPDDVLNIAIKDEGSDLIGDAFGSGLKYEIHLKDFNTWSPEDPYLYAVEFWISREDQLIDQVDSYFGMREVEKKMADDGFVRLYLNGEEVFQNGPLDQGFWPDGLYTPPTDEAMKYDIATTRELGFNMLRKHVKVENRRFYFWCDKLGIMVWQDMPSTSGYVAPGKDDLERPEKETEQFKLELERMILTKFNHPSIVMWVPFNEGWGQFDTEEIVDFIHKLDPDRLVNNTSGWADRGVGDVIDIHHYPDPRVPDPEKDRASVLGEFGGLGLYVDGHTWEQKNWGYRKMSDSLALLHKYEQFYTTVWKMMAEQGLAAAVYTQTTDVETETNGLISYDREVLKLDQEVLKGINTNNYVPAPRFKDEEEEGIFNKSHEVVILGGHGDIYYTLDGSEPTTGSMMYDHPITIRQKTLVRAASFLNNEKSIVIEKQYTLTEKKPPFYRKPFDQRYSGGGIFALIDGKYGGLSFSDGKWQGFRSNGLDVVIDLGSNQDISSITGNFLIHYEGWIFLPGTFSIYISDDGKAFTLVDEMKTNIPEGFKEAAIQQLSFENLDVKARYVNLRAETIGAVPAWHKTAQGRASWFFIDEIIIK